MNKQILLLVVIGVLASGCTSEPGTIEEASQEATDIDLTKSELIIPGDIENATFLKASSAYQVKRGTSLRVMVMVTHLGENTETYNVSNMTVDEVINILKEIEEEGEADFISLNSVSFVVPEIRSASVGEDGRWEQIEEFEFIHKPGNKTNDSFSLPNTRLRAIGSAGQLLEEFDDSRDTAFYQRFTELMSPTGNMAEEQRETKFAELMEDIERFDLEKTAFLYRNTYRELIDIPIPEDAIPGDVEVKVILNYSRTMNGHTYYNLLKTTMPNGKKNTIL